MSLVNERHQDNSDLEHQCSVPTLNPGQGIFVWTYCQFFFFFSTWERLGKHILKHVTFFRLILFSPLAGGSDSWEAAEREVHQELRFYPALPPSHFFFFFTGNSLLCLRLIKKKETEKTSLDLNHLHKCSKAISWWTHSGFEGTRGLKAQHLCTFLTSVHSRQKQKVILQQIKVLGQWIPEDSSQALFLDTALA